MGAALGSWGRGLFGLCLALSWASSVTQLVSAHRPVYGRQDLRVALPRGLPLAALAAASILFAVSLAGFIRGIWLGASGIMIVALMTGLRQFEIRQWPGNIVDLGKYVPALACLCGFLIAYAAAAGQSAPRREACGWGAACGVAGACYALAGWAKLRTPKWADSKHLGMLIAERSYRGWSWARSLRRGLSVNPRLCGALAVVSLWSELLSGFLFLWPAARLSVAVAMGATHAGIFLFLGYFEPEWILLLFGLAWVPR